MFQLLWDAFGNGSVEERQMDSQIRVLMNHIHEDLPHRHGDGQLLPALPDEGLLLRLSWLHLAAYKLPFQTPGLVSRPLADHELIGLPNQGGYHFRHDSSPFPLK